MHNMLIRPTPEELADFGEPDFVIYNSGEISGSSLSDCLHYCLQLQSKDVL